MSESINKIPQGPEHEGPEYEPTPEGLGMALDYTLRKYFKAIEHTPAERGDMYGRTGGDSLTLYPDPSSPNKTIHISPVGKDADSRRFSGAADLHVDYSGKRDQGSGIYRVGGAQGSRHVTQWNAHPELLGAIDPSGVDTKNLAVLIAAVTAASPEKPASRSSKTVRRIGELLGRGAGVSLE